MRNTGPFSQYNRAIVRSQKPDGVSESLLGMFGALEIHLLSDIVRWAEADATTYVHKV